MKHLLIWVFGIFLFNMKFTLQGIKSVIMCFASFGLHILFSNAAEIEPAYEAVKDNVWKTGLNLLSDVQIQSHTWWKRPGQKLNCVP